MAMTFMEGNEAIGLGALAAGCRFFAGYPITPATTVFASMVRLLPPAGGICLQCEDEIASTGACLGASMAGLKAMTATSGPGISLYSEHISFAIGSEIPIVIIDVQRLGPSTGSATRGADGDIQFLRWGNSGGIPVIVLAPVDVRDCYELTVHAFNLAEEFRCPVFIASNKEIGMTREGVDMDNWVTPPLKERKFAPEKEPYLPFRVTDESGVPPFLPIGGKVLVRQTSSTHGEDGFITIDPAKMDSERRRLADKILKGLSGFTFYDEQAADGADTLVITYGVTARAAAAAVKNLKASGRPVSLLVLKTLWPVPEQLISAKAEGYRRIVVVEMNLGQYVREIQRVLSDKKVDFFGRMNGDLISPATIEEVINNG
ncbi:MAG: transketolase C-terminal domain-containing protein [Desulfatiglandaceae bacterium]